MGYSIQSIGIQGTYVPTTTGVLSDLGCSVARYTLVGKLCTLWITTNAMTSNSTAKTITAPFAASGSGTQSFTTGMGVNNGSNLSNPICIRTTANSNVLNLFSNSTPAAWTASNGWSCQFVITYEIA